MDTTLNVIKWSIANYQALLTGVMGLISAAIAIALIIPGEQPDKALQGALDFLLKFSRK